MGKSTTQNGPKVVNMGCRLNAFEAEQIRQRLGADMGAEMAAETANQQVDDGRELIIINSCAVTNEAVRQTAQMARRLRRDSPNARLAVTGCAAQIDPQKFAAMAEIDMVIGNQEKFDPASYRPKDRQTSDGQNSPTDKIMVGDYFASETEKLRGGETTPLDAREILAPPPLSGFGTRARGFVQIQTGCDHRCTFCVIPYGRGPSRSVSEADCFQQIEALLEAGAHEIVLCGVDMTAWGRDIGRDFDKNEGLGALVTAILTRFPDLPRLRLSSVDCSEIDDKLLAAFGTYERLMPHLHLSLQAGDPLILKRMKRRHSPEQAVALTQKLRAVRPDIIFGADMIVGFPTEDETQFQNSLDHAAACDLTWLHVFPFSARTGTPAAKIPNQIDLATRKARAARLREWGSQAEQRHLTSLIGTSQAMLIEDKGQGHGPSFAKFYLDPDIAHAYPQGTILQVTPTHLYKAGLQVVPTA